MVLNHLSLLWLLTLVHWGDLVLTKPKCVRLSIPGESSVTHLHSPKVQVVGSYLYINCRNMSTGEGEEPEEPVGSPTAPRPNIQLSIKFPTFSWEGNQYENFKTFKMRTTILMEGPYKKVNEMDKVAAMLGWLGDKGFQLYASIDWEAIEKDKDKYKDVLEGFELHFRPCQTELHSWYQLGSVYSNHCKNQTDFMQKLRDIAKETGFKEKDEIVKFLFIIHNTDQKVREYLLDKAEPNGTLNDFLKLAKTVESMVKTESMSRELLANAGKTQIGAVGKQRRGSGSRGPRSQTPYGRGGVGSGNKCKKCGRGHPPRKCPAFKERCRRCNGLGHFERCCRTKNPGQPRSDTRKPKYNHRYSRRDQHEVTQGAQGHYQGPTGLPYDSDYELQADSVQVIYCDQGKTNIKFDEIDNSQALGDLTLLNKRGQQVNQRFKLDSGACANLLPLGIYSKLFSSKDRDLKSTIDHRITLVAANNKEIPQLGTVNLRVRVPDKEKVCRFYVVPDTCRPIFGLPDLKKMDLVQFKVPVTSHWSDYVSEIEEKRTPVDLQSQGLTKDEVLTKYKKVFTGLGRLKVTPVKIHLRPGAKPEQAPIRRVPVAIRQKFKEELQSMVQQKTIRKLDKNVAPPWLNSFVNVGKDDGHLRVCIDPTRLNPHIIRPICNSYTLDEISYMIKDAKVLTVVDANKGFFQVPLDEESQLLTAMGTPEGIYVFNVLAMGLALASDVFEIIIRDIIKDLKGVINIADDILIFGKDVKEHDENLIALLDKALEVNLTLNPKKLKFKCTSVPFFGNILTDQGIMPDPKKVEAIKQWPVPQNVKDLQSFLGAVNFLGKFIQGLSSLRVSLQGLIKKDSEYLWTAAHQHAFENIKEAICKETLLAYYDKDKPVFIEVDASGQGLGAVLLQGNILEDELENSSQTEGRFLQFRNRLRPIAYASKSLSDAETRYSNIERELLGVVWAVEHFHHYTFANKINIISDHKPLHPLFSGKTLVSCSARTARLLLKIVDKDIRFYYQNGPTMHISDALSRLPIHNTQAGNKTEIKDLKVTISEVSPVMTNVSLNQFKEHTQQRLGIETITDLCHGQVGLVNKMTA